MKQRVKVAREHPVLEEMHKQNDEIHAKGRAIREALKGRNDRASLTRLARDTATFTREVLRPHQIEEDKVLLSVVREHTGGAPAPALDEEAAKRRELERDLAHLEADLEGNKDCSRSLGVLADHLCAYAEYGEKGLLPWAQKELGDILLREADARLSTYGKKEPDVKIPPMDDLMRR